MLKGGKGRFALSDPLPYAQIDKEMEKSKKQKKKRPKLEWKDRWVVIHQRILTVCKDRSVRSCLFDGFLFVPIVYHYVPHRIRTHYIASR
jgi:hypothetical protein